MASEYYLFEYLEAENAAAMMHRKQRRLILRTQSDPFDLDEREFMRRYRLTRDLAFDLCDELRPLMKRPRKSTDLSAETKVLTALSFYATGSYQRAVGSMEGQFMAQQTVSAVIAEVTRCLNTSAMRRKYINFPQNTQERNRVITDFNDIFGIPNVVGCIDCTHVALIRPVLYEERYYCRKHYHSLNVQLVCDANMFITSVDASFGGSNHDAFIWESHPLRGHIENLYNSEAMWLLGDSGYPLRRTLMTPVLNAIPNTPEAHYTNLHVKCRNVIERTIGVLKARFRSLLVHRVLHYSPEIAGLIVNACVILHNICNRANIPVSQLSDEDVNLEAQLQQPDPQAVQMQQDPSALQEGTATRDSLIGRLWDRRRF